MSTQRGKRKEKIGVVIADKMNKTVVVKCDRLTKHTKYKKFIRRSKTFMAHNEENQAKLNDKVRICETRPLSKQKRWRITEVLK